MIDKVADLVEDRIGQSERRSHFLRRQRIRRIVERVIKQDATVRKMRTCGLRTFELEQARGDEFLFHLVEETDHARYGSTPGNADR